MDKLERILQILISFMCTIPLLVVAFITMRYNVSVTHGWEEIINISRVPYTLYIVLVLVIVILLCGRIFDGIDSRKFLCVGMACFAICGLYLVFNADTSFRADQSSCFKIANNINVGNFSDFKKGNYIDTYPFQLGWITLEQILIKFSKNISFMYFCFFVFSALSIILLWLISKEIKQKNYVQNMTLMLSLLFFPHLFNIMFVYGNVPGYLLFLCAVYFQIKSIKSDRIRYYVLTVFFGVSSFILKSNFEIGLIAITIIYVLEIVRHPKSRKFYITIVMILGLIPVSSSIIGKYYSKKSGYKVTLNAGIPKQAFIAMGMQEGSGKFSGRYGWYNEYTIRTYAEKGYNTQKTAQAAKKEIGRRINIFRENPKYAFKFYKNKIVSTWGDSMHQSIWNGPLKVNTEIMKLIYRSDAKGYSVLCYISKIIEIIIIIFTLVSSFGLLYKKECNITTMYVLLAIIYFTGGFLFHLMWETKAQYTYQYVSMLIPSAALGIVMCREKVGILTDRMIFRLKNRR